MARTLTIRLNDLEEKYLDELIAYTGASTASGALMIAMKELQTFKDGYRLEIEKNRMKELSLQIQQKSIDKFLNALNELKGLKTETAD